MSKMSATTMRTNTAVTTKPTQPGVTWSALIGVGVGVGMLTIDQPTLDTMSTLDVRYGRRPARGRILGVWIAGGVLALAAIVWAVWAQPWSIGDFWKSTGYQVVDDRTIDVTWNVTLGDGEAARCAIAAQNPVHAIVGWKVVEVVGTELPTRQLTERLRTTERADTGLAYRCWLP